MKRSPRLAVSLDQIVIRSPCAVPWESMRGDEQVRFCGQCRQNVYNIEQMGRREAERLIGEREGSVCVRLLRRDDGTVVTADCWTRLRAARRRGLLVFAAMLVIVLFDQLWAVRFGWRWLTSDDPPPPAPLAEVRGAAPIAGGIAPPPPEPRRLMGEAPAAPRGHHKLGRLMGKRAPSAEILGGL